MREQGVSSAMIRRPACWPLRSLIMGDCARREFRDCLEVLAEQTVLQYASGTSCAAIGEEEPDLIVLLASRPGEYSHDFVESLRQQAPLARMIGLLGTWCEGEMRTGRPWPAVPRLYWHQGANWLKRELALLALGSAGALSLPLTATEEERLPQFSNAGKEQPGTQIEIFSRSPAMAEMLAEACQALGYGVCRRLGSGGAARAGIVAGIWEETLSSPAELARIAADDPGIPWIAVVGFPRLEDVLQLQAAGVAGILSKPLLLDDLRIALAPLATS